jgi:hypothetical protein
MTLPALLLGCLLIGQADQAAWLDPSAYDWRLALDPRCLAASAPLDEVLRAPGFRPLWSSVCREIAARRDRLATLLRERRTMSGAPRERELLLLVETLLAMPLPPLSDLEVYGLPVEPDRVAVLAVLRAGTDIQAPVLAWIRQSPIADLVMEATYRGRPALRYRDQRDGLEVSLVLDGSWALLLGAPLDRSDPILERLPVRSESAPIGAGGDLLELELSHPPAIGPLAGRRYRFRLRCDGGELIEEHRLMQLAQPLFREGKRTRVILPERDALLRGSMHLAEPALAKTLIASLPPSLVAWLEPLAPWLTGDVALGVYPPARGALFPGFVLRLGLADAVATGRQLEAMLAGPAPLLVQAIAVGGRRAFACEIPNNPLALAPAAAIRDSEMWIAANATLLEQAMASDGPPLEDPDRAAPLFFRFDATRLVAVLTESYLPRVVDERTGGERPVLDPAQLPRTGELARNLGSGEITARMDGDAVVVVQRSKVGGVQNALLAPIAALAFLESVGSTLEQLRVEVESDLCARRLMQVKGALEAYRSCFGGGNRYPRSLSELYVTGLIEDRRTLLVPSDAAPEILHYENERGEPSELQVSYRLIDNSRMTIENRPVLLYEARTNRHGGRFVIFRDGGMSHYSEDLFVQLFGEAR